MQADVQGTVIRNSNPTGCHNYLQQQWHQLKEKPAGHRYNNILVIGCSSGFGLATRLAALRNGAQCSIGVCFERAPSDNQSGSAGWHLDQAFTELAQQNSHLSISLHQDAFLDSTKNNVIETIKKLNRKFDLVIYSVAAGIKLNANGDKIRSAILPTKAALAGYQVDLSNHLLHEIELPAANEQQIQDTVNVMGGDDWQLWMNKLNQAGVLTDNCQTYNYSYLGGDLNAAIYRDGTLGAAKNHMHNTAEQLRSQGFNAAAVVCKALVTKASLFIPLMAPYLMALKAELKTRSQDENIFDQMHRLLAGDFIQEGDLLRLDNYELSEDVQQGVMERLSQLTPENFVTLLDYHGIRNELLAMHGFETD